MPITDYSTEKLLHLYRQMLLVREFELRAISRTAGRTHPGFHPQLRGPGGNRGRRVRSPGAG